MMLLDLIPLRKGLIGVYDLRGKPLSESNWHAVCIALNEPDYACILFY